MPRALNVAEMIPIICAAVLSSKVAPSALASTMVCARAMAVSDAVRTLICVALAVTAAIALTTVSRNSIPRAVSLVLVPVPPITPREAVVALRTPFSTTILMSFTRLVLAATAAVSFVALALMLVAAAIMSRLMSDSSPSCSGKDVEGDGTGDRVEGVGGDGEDDSGGGEADGDGAGLVVLVEEVGDGDGADGEEVDEHVSAAQAVFKEAKAELLFQASAIRRLLHEAMDVAEVKVLLMVATFAMFHVGKPSPANLDAPRNVSSSIVTLATFHLLRSEFISPAKVKVDCRVVTEVVSHDPKPVPANLDAPWNVHSSIVTLATFHPLRSEFISAAALKVECREVAEVVVHLLIAVPTNVDAFGLPFTTCEPPVTSRFWEKAQLKSPTPLTSQSPMSPHVAVAVAVSWTQSMGGTYMSLVANQRANKQE